MIHALFLPLRLRGSSGIQLGLVLPSLPASFVRYTPQGTSQEVVSDFLTSHVSTQAPPPPMEGPLCWIVR